MGSGCDGTSLHHTFYESPRFTLTADDRTLSVSNGPRLGGTTRTMGEVIISGLSMEGDSFFDYSDRRNSDHQIEPTPERSE